MKPLSLNLMVFYIEFFILLNIKLIISKIIIIIQVLEKKEKSLGININLFFIISINKLGIKKIIKINKGIDNIFWYKAWKKFKLKISWKALVIPQLGQLIPVNCLKIQFTGLINTIIKNNININKTIILIYFLFIITNLLMDFLFHQHLYFLLIT